MSDESTDVEHDDGEFDDLFDWSRISEVVGEFEDRLGRIEERTEGDEIVLTRVSNHNYRPPFDVLRFQQSLRLLRISPRSTRHGALVPQFDRIVELQIESPGWNPSRHSAEHGRYGLLYARGLPKGFSAIYEFGLGVKRDYRDFVDGIQRRTQCTILRFVAAGAEGLDEAGAVFRVSLDRFDEYRAAVDRSRARGRTAVSRVIEADAHNAISELFDLEKVQPKFTRHPVIRAITEEVATGHVVDAGERIQLADEVTRAATELSREAPERLVKLREDIELVSLDAMIDLFAGALDGPHSRDENHWQKFFNNNRFALQLVFSTPIVIEREHATVQAGDIDGRGTRITDFLCANAVTRTVVIVEIKTPSAALVTTNAYRGRGTGAAVYPPHADLIGAVAQLQSQIASVPRSLAFRLTAEDNLDPWNDTRGALIVGRISALNDQQRESFLRFRSSLSTITVLGYDEVLDRLKALRVMLDAPARLNLAQSGEHQTKTRAVPRT